MFFADKYEVTPGICHNSNGEYGSVFVSHSTPTLQECKKMCDSTPGCTAVSYHEAYSNCHGTSKKEYTTRTDSDWKCYYKPG